LKTDNLYIYNSGAIYIKNYGGGYYFKLKAWSTM